VADSRQWYREVITVRAQLARWVADGHALTDPHALRLAERLDRLTIQAMRAVPRGGAGEGGERDGG
jgi:hypothetical protein